MIGDMSGKPSTEQQETVEALLDASQRASRRVNIRQSFVQDGPQSRPVTGPIHRMLRAHDERVLDLYLLHRALVSSEPWSTRPLDSRVWARAIGVHDNDDGGIAMVSKIWRRLDETYRLVQRHRDGRLAVLTALREDGSGEPYTSPNGKARADRYFTLPFEYWTADQRWYVTLSLPAKVMLLIASSQAPDFVLPTEKANAWYGISTESAERGLRTLREVGLLSRRTTLKHAPLSPTGTTQEYHYTLTAPFGRLKKPKLTVIRDRSVS